MKSQAYLVTILIDIENILGIVNGYKHHVKYIKSP